MAVIAYKQTTFLEPPNINEEAYWYYKKTLMTNPDFKINTSIEKFTSHFKRRLITLTWMLPLFGIAVGYDLYFKDTPSLPPTALNIIIGVIIVLGFISALILLALALEGPSYAIYLYKKQHYFIGLEHAIKISKDYQDFEQLFYGGLKNRAANYKIRAKEAMAINKPPTTVDSIFILIFRIIDVLTVVVGCIGIILLIKHYCFDK